jgi:hypothetical protein
MKEIEKLREQVLGSIPTIKHRVFKDNLFLTYCDEVWMNDNHVNVPKRQKVTFEELDRPNLMCILSNHNPSWKDVTQKRLDMKLLKDLGVF